MIVQVPFYLAPLSSCCFKATLTKLIWSGSAKSFTNFLLSSRILLLNDLNSRIPVTVSPSGTQAILSGIGKREPNLEYLPDNFILDDKENVVFTSGKDGVLFPGIAVGKIVLEDNKKLVKLFADPDQINFVSVALDQQEDSGAR